MCPNQAEFRPGRDCADQIFMLRRVLEHRFKYQQSTVTCFIDFASAFDSIDRAALWKVMECDREDHSAHKGILLASLA
ncbi:unnamed protein product [Dracunculus medinensis]|uniref:Reverse transcriptase domain-containing protein n=1 Tax=Dracunculus medinensis TaxID=318479 RepID=A0A0N4UQL9_DRAME|nr:unnamed protein product [Dracunculus medinensis]